MHFSDRGQSATLYYTHTLSACRNQPTITKKGRNKSIILEIDPKTSAAFSTRLFFLYTKFEEKKNMPFISAQLRQALLGLRSRSDKCSLFAFHMVRLGHIVSLMSMSIL